MKEVITSIKCDLCKEKVTHVFYHTKITENSEYKVELQNNGLYCEKCLPVIKTMPILNPSPCE